MGEREIICKHDDICSESCDGRQGLQRHHFEPVNGEYREHQVAAFAMLTSAKGHWLTSGRRVERPLCANSGRYDEVSCSRGSPPRLAVHMAYIGGRGTPELRARCRGRKFRFISYRDLTLWTLQGRG